MKIIHSHHPCAMHTPVIPPRSNRRRLTSLGLAAWALLGGRLTLAQEWSAKTVRVVVPYPPGSGPDALAREWAEQAAQLSGKAVIVDNKPGANGIIGTDLVVRAAADGATLLVLDPLALVANPYIYKSVPHVWQRDLRPLSTLADADLFLFSSAKTPFRSIGEVIQYARQHPGKLNFGTVGNASVEHLSVERLKAHTGIEVTRIPYTGMGQLIPALLTGEIDLFVFGPLSFLPHLKEGRVRALVAGSAQRSAVLPEVPTLAEVGLPADLFIGTTFTLLAPARLPDSTAQEIVQLSETVVGQAKFREKFAARGLTARFDKGASLANWLRQADQRLGPLIRSLQLPPLS